MKDPDLVFLESCDNDQLLVLADILTFDPKDNKARINESLTKTKEWILYYPDEIKKLLPEMEKELSSYAGNPIVNSLRGKGVSYRETLCDVCKKLNIHYNEIMSTKVIEDCLLQVQLMKFIENTPNEQLEDLLSGIYKISLEGNPPYNLKNYLKDKLSNMDIEVINKLCVGLASSIANRWEGEKPEILQNILISFGIIVPFILAPTIWILPTLTAGFDFASNVIGTDYRITIPATLYISCLRRIK